MTMNFTEGLIIVIAGIFEAYLLLILIGAIEIEKMPALMLIALAFAAISCIIMGVRAIVAAFLEHEILTT